MQSNKGKVQKKKETCKKKNKKMFGGVGGPPELNIVHFNFFLFCTFLLAMVMTPKTEE